MYIRPATQEDAIIIAKLINLAMIEITYQFIGKEDENEANDFIAHFVRQNNNQYSYENIYVIASDKEIIGQICLYDGGKLQALRKPILDKIKQDFKINYQAADETQAGEIYIDTFAVLPNYQGQGIGKKLLEFAIDKVVKQDRKTLGLLVDNDNPAAKRLYERLGFNVVNEVEIFGKKMEHMQYA